MQQMTMDELKENLIANRKYFLLDVRNADEHAAFNIGGTVIPLNEIMNNVARIPTDEPVIVCCRKGLRSQIAIQRLEIRYGFTNLINLQGGVQYWER